MKNLWIIFSIYNNGIDFDIHENKEPVFTHRVKPVLHDFVNWRTEKTLYWQFFEEVEYKTYDSFFPQMTPTKQGSFYKTESFSGYSSADVR